MNIHEAILDAIDRGWLVTFERGRVATLTITGRKTHDGKEFQSVLTLAPGADREQQFVARRVMYVTDDRRLPPTEAEQLRQAIEERQRRDPEAPEPIYF